MEHARFPRFIALFALTALVVSGCGKANPTTIPLAQVSGPTSAHNANAKELLYLTDIDKGVVHALDFETGAKEGELRHFSYPRGQCVDAKGDLYVANSGFTTVNEYRHGETRPLRTIRTDGSPIGCSVSPNGDLAIANEHTSAGNGNVLVFKQAKGKPQIYSARACDRIAAAGYDGAGNLYVEREHYSSSTICELPVGGSSMTSVGTNVRLNQPNGVMWDGEHITLTDSDYPYGTYGATAIYQMKEARSGKLLKIGRTVLTMDGCGQRVGITFPFILGKVNTPKNQRLADEVVGYQRTCPKVNIWKYPAGGVPIRTIKAAFSSSYSQAVSIGE